jgi:hypothetical protein
MLHSAEACSAASDVVVQDEQAWDRLGKLSCNVADTKVAVRRELFTNAVMVQLVQMHLESSCNARVYCLYCSLSCMAA